MRRTRISDFEQCPCTGKNLDKLLHAAILTLLAQEPLHGYELVNRLASLRMFQGRKPDPTGVYRLIRQMEEERLVRSTLEPSATGPAKRSNQLTVEGKRCLARWGETLEAFQEGVSELLAAIKTIRRR
jgi:DNA-binding PadR family transcriptional regulator